MKSVFEYNDYKKYLNDYLKSQPKRGHGLKQAFANAAGCQVAYISHVLVRDNDLSSEQGEAICRFIGLTDDETEFFLLILQKSRAGTHQLKKVLEKMLSEKKEKFSDLKKRMNIKETLDLADQAEYYSKWYYSAVHMILTIPEFRTLEKIASYFDLEPKKARSILEFLRTRGLVELVKGEFILKGSFLHLENNSPLISHHHTNWRMKAIQSLESERENDLHFSSCFSISAEDVLKLKAMLSRQIQESSELIKPSKEEKLYSLNVDLFEVQ